MGAAVAIDIRDGLGSVSNTDDYMVAQQKLNYMDTIKDGANVPLVQMLNVYPRAAEGIGYPTPWEDELHAFESKVLDKNAAYLTRTTWTKVARGTELDEPKEYSEVFWESGLGYKTFVADPDKNVKTIKTFGSYIDPLDKQNADRVWPNTNESINITPAFMNLMGFGDSEVNAKTLSLTEFEYEMRVGCGDVCQSRPSKCEISRQRGQKDTNIEKYYAGNTAKGKTIQSAPTEDKVRLLVAKEWGDKLQAVIYFMYQNVGKSKGATPVMITCDMVVMIFCIMLKVPCVYTSKVSHYFPKPQGIEGKFYSIVEYKPTDKPIGDAKKRCAYVKKAVLEENTRYIGGLRLLARNTNTPVRLGGQDVIYPAEFWNAVADDAQSYQNKLSQLELPNYKDKANNPAVAGEISEYNTIIQNIKSNYLLVQMVRSSAKPKGKQTRPSPKAWVTGILTMSMGQKYTLGGDSGKPAVMALLQGLGMDMSSAERQSQRPLYESARLLAPKRGGRKHNVHRQRGGALALTTAEIMEAFPDFPQPVDMEFRYSRAALGDTPDIPPEGYNGGKDGPIYAPHDPPYDEPEVANLQEVLVNSLDEAVDTYFNTLLKMYPELTDYYQNFHLTMESLLLYNASYIAAAPPVVEPQYLEFLQQTYIPDLFTKGVAPAPDPVAPDPISKRVGSGYAGPAPDAPVPVTLEELVAAAKTTAESKYSKLIKRAQTLGLTPVDATRMMDEAKTEMIDYYRGLPTRDQFVNAVDGMARLFAEEINKVIVTQQAINPGTARGRSAHDMSPELSQPMEAPSSPVVATSIQRLGTPPLSAKGSTEGRFFNFKRRGANEPNVLANVRRTVNAIRNVSNRKNARLDSNFTRRGLVSVYGGRRRTMRKHHKSHPKTKTYRSRQQPRQYRKKRRTDSKRVR
jgi:hypothetical protein